MDIEALRARGVSTTLRGTITNPVRRLLWPFLAPYFVALLEQIATSSREGTGARMPTDRVAADDGRELSLRVDALHKDLSAVAHRLASIEDGPPPRPAAMSSATGPHEAESPRPSHAQCGEDLIIDYVLRRAGAPAAIRYLDIGAAYPSGDNNTFLFHERGGSGVLVEADPGYVAHYRAVRPRDMVESAAVVPASQKPTDGTVELLVMDDKGWTSILPSRIAEAARRGKGGLRQRISVPAVTVGEILDRHFAGQDLHLLSLDIEGLDETILRDVDFERHRPWIIVMETMGESGPTDFLAGHGYAAYADTHVNRIFVRRDILERMEH